MGRMEENYFAALPVTIYSVVLLDAAIAYFIDSCCCPWKNSMLSIAIGSDFKGKISVVIYIIAIPSAFVNS